MPTVGLPASICNRYKLPKLKIPLNGFPDPHAPCFTAGRLVQLGAACAAVALALAVAAWLRSSPLPPHLRPFPGPKLAALPQFQGDHAQRMLWGTYRPGLYFGESPNRLPRCA